MACVGNADEEERENTPPDRTDSKNRQTLGATGCKFSANAQDSRLRTRLTRPATQLTAASEAFELCKASAKFSTDMALLAVVASVSITPAFKAPRKPAI